MAFSQTASINVLPHKNVHPAVSHTWLLQLLLSSLTNSPPYCEAFISTLFVSFTAATKWHSLLRFGSWWEEGPLGGRNHELNISQTVAYPPCFARAIPSKTMGNKGLAMCPYVHVRNSMFPLFSLLFPPSSHCNHHKQPKPTPQLNHSLTSKSPHQCILTVLQKQH